MLEGPAALGIGIVVTFVLTAVIVGLLMVGVTIGIMYYCHSRKSKGKLEIGNSNGHGTTTNGHGGVTNPISLGSLLHKDSKI